MATPESIRDALLAAVHRGASPEDVGAILHDVYGSVPVEIREAAAAMAADVLRAEAAAHEQHAEELHRFDVKRRMARAGLRVIE